MTRTTKVKYLPTFLWNVMRSNDHQNQMNAFWKAGILDLGYGTARSMKRLCWPALILDNGPNSRADDATSLLICLPLLRATGRPAQGWLGKSPPSTPAILILGRKTTNRLDSRTPDPSLTNFIANSVVAFGLFDILGGVYDQRRKTLALFFVSLHDHF
jgi:hypothetical protein